MWVPIVCAGWILSSSSNLEGKQMSVPLFPSTRFFGGGRGRWTAWPFCHPYWILTPQGPLCYSPSAYEPNAVRWLWIQPLPQHYRWQHARDQACQPQDAGNDAAVYLRPRERLEGG